MSKIGLSVNDPFIVYLAKADPKTDAELSCTLNSELFRHFRINWKPPNAHKV